MKTIISLLLAVGLLFITGCTTPVAIDPRTGLDQTAKYQAGYFYGPLEAPIDQVFRVAIRELDAMGYFRTGELHRDTSITIYGRKVGDEKIEVRTYVPTKSQEMPEGHSMLRIRIGTMGNLAESQNIYARIRAAL